MSLLDVLPAIGGAAGIAALIVAIRTAGAQGRKLDADADVGEATADKARAEARAVTLKTDAEHTAEAVKRLADDAERLTARVARLEAENVALRDQLAAVTRDKVADEAEIARLRGEIAHRDERIRDLEARIEVLEHAAANRRETDAAGVG